jgi:Carboxypeptidase regulatory-like domain
VSANGFRWRIYPDLHIPRSDSQPLDVFLNPASQPDHCGYVNTVDYEAVGLEARILSGYVIYEDTGKGISGVKVELKNAASGSNVGATVSGPDGTFAFRDLPAGRYSVRASRNAYEPTEMTQFLVPRENLTILHLGLDKRGHLHICQ